MNWFIILGDCDRLKCALLKRTCWSPKPSKPQHVTVFGNGVLEEVIKVKWGHMDGPSSNMTTVLLRRGHLDKHKLHEGWAHTEEGSCEEAARGQPSASQGERLREKQPCWPLDLGLSASRGVRKKFLLFKAPSLWFITANEHDDTIQTSLLPPLACWPDRKRRAWDKALLPRAPSSFGSLNFF